MAGEQDDRKIIVNGVVYTASASDKVIFGGGIYQEDAPVGGPATEEAALAFAITAGATYARVATVEESVSYGVSAGFTSLADATAGGSITGAINAGMTLDTLLSVGALLSFSIQNAMVTTADATAEGAISDGVTAGYTNTALIAGAAIEAALSFGVTSNITFDGKRISGSLISSTGHTYTVQIDLDHTVTVPDDYTVH